MNFCFGSNALNDLSSFSAGFALNAMLLTFNEEVKFIFHFLRVAKALNKISIFYFGIGFCLEPTFKEIVMAKLVSS